MIIAIDGPAGAGKTTVARELARELGFTHIETGAMYRAVALRCARKGIGPEDEEAVVREAQAARIEFAPDPHYHPKLASLEVIVGQEPRTGPIVYLDGEDVTSEIRNPEISELASAVSALPGVRRVLVEQQRAMASRGNVVMEGRDIGTVVCPNADVKVFLTASLEERAYRRHKELQFAGIESNLEDIKQSIAERDERDSTRAASPLTIAPDAVVIDTDGRAPESIVAQIVDLVRSRA